MSATDIVCQTADCPGWLDEQEALDSLREYGSAWCATCRSVQREAEAVDRQVDDALERRAGL